MIWTVIFSGIGIIFWVILGFVCKQDDDSKLNSNTAAFIIILIASLFTTIGIFTYATSDDNCTIIINDYNNGNIIKETRIIGNDTMYVYKYR